MAESTPKTTPKDFVLWLGTMITLYVSVGSLITLLFSYIDILYPDQLAQYYYYDPFSGGIRFAMASLIILVPVFIGLTRYVNQDLRKNPEKKNIGIRKWLLYLTLLAAGAFIVGDLIALVNGFLGGELTTRFTLKVLVILVVAGGVFSYYFADMKGRWEKNESQSKMIGALLAVLVLASIISGFMLLGSPQQQRELRFDQQRISDLQNIQWQLISYWQSKGRLPQVIGELEDPLTGFVMPEDPVTHEVYRYRMLSERSFELCATFAHESSQTQRLAPEKMYGMMDENWDHQAGDACFERTIDPERFPVNRGVTVPMQ